MTQAEFEEQSERFRLGYISALRLAIHIAETNPTNRTVAEALKHVLEIHSEGA